MKRRIRLSALAVMAFALGACANHEALIQAQFEADTETCLSQGFESGSEAFALCRILQNTNRRLDSLSQRLQFVESDLRFLDLRVGRGFRSSRYVN